MMRVDAIAGVTISKKRAAASSGRDASVYVSRWHTGGPSVNLELFGRRALTMTPSEAVLMAERLLWAARKAELAR